MTTTTPDVSFVKNQPEFFLIGFNPEKEQWQYTVRLGNQSFEYSGGLWAFASGSRDKVKRKFYANSREADLFDKIASGRIRISKNRDDKSVQLVVAEIGKHNKPEAVSVFQSLILDMDAGEMNFQDYCDEFEENNDSIAALITHQACQSNARKFLSVVSKEEITRLREALQDY